MSDELPLARRDLIAARLADGQSVASVQLAAEFEVSEDAIRRDLRALAAEGRCRRVYGGALPLTARPLSARLGEGIERKQALAARAVGLIERGCLLFLDAGSAQVALVDVLPEDFSLTVATNSVDVAAAVLKRQDMDLLMIGGAVDATIGGAVDAVAIDAISRLCIDLAFIGVCSLSVADGIAAVHHADATFKRAVIGASRKSAALITNDKFDARASYKVAAVNSLSHFVVEQDAPRGVLAALSDAGVEVVSAEAPI